MPPDTRNRDVLLRQAEPAEAEAITPTLHFFAGGVEASGGIALCGYRFRGLVRGPWAFETPSDCPVCDDLRGLNRA